MDRLDIRRLVATNFGGLQNRTVVLPDDPFVVLHGPNESGKSTMAEAMAWLLTNMPETKLDKQLVERLGGAGSTLSAELDWSIAGLDYRSKGSFKLNMTTVSKTSTIEISGPDQADLDVSDLGRMLGGVDYDIFDHVFRVRGEDGHIETNGNVSDLVQRTTLGASGGGLRSWDLIEDLEKRGKALTTSRAQGSESVKALLDAAQESAGEMDAAGRNAEEFRHVQNELGQHQKLKNELDAELVGLKGDVSALETARTAHAPFEKMLGIQAQLDEAPEPDPAWDRFTERIDEFDSAVAARDQASTSLEGAQTELRRVVDALGPPWTEEMLAEVTLARGSVDAVHKLVGKLEAETGAAATADGRVEDRQVAVSGSAAELEAAEERWRSLEPEADPDGWLDEVESRERAGVLDVASPGRTQLNGDRSLSTVLGAATVGLGVLIAVVGFVAGQPLLGLLGLAVAGVGGVAVWLTRRPAIATTEHDGGLPSSDEAGLQGRRRAAEQVVEARRALDESRRELGEARETLANETETVRDLEDQIEGVLRTDGVMVPIDPTAADQLADRVLDARTAQTQLGAHSDTLIAAESALYELRRIAPADWQDRSDDATAAEAARQAELASTRSDLERDREEERKAYLAVVAGNDRIHSMLESHGLAGIEEKLHQVEGEVAGADEAREAAVNEIGRLEQQLDDLRSAEKLDGLRFEQNQLRAQAEEKLAEAVVVAAARDLLTDVVERFERENRPAIVKEAERIVRRVNPDVAELHATPEDGVTELGVETADGVRLPDEVLSTGGRALLYLGLRLAAAEHESEERQVRLPLLLDDALVHLDDDRLLPMIEVLAEVSARHQVLLFTCHERTVDAARRYGATLVELTELTD